MKEQFNLCLSRQFCKYIVSNFFLCNLCTRQYSVSFCLIPASEQTLQDLKWVSSETYLFFGYSKCFSKLMISVPFKITTVYFSYRLEARKRNLRNEEPEASTANGGF